MTINQRTWISFKPEWSGDAEKKQTIYLTRKSNWTEPMVYSVHKSSHGLLVIARVMNAARVD